MITVGIVFFMVLHCNCVTFDLMQLISLVILSHLSRFPSPTVWDKLTLMCWPEMCGSCFFVSAVRPRPRAVRPRPQSNAIYCPRTVRVRQILTIGGRGVKGVDQTIGIVYSKCIVLVVGLVCKQTFISDSRQYWFKKFCVLTGCKPCT
jgi:hypothetical protein